MTDTAHPSPPAKAGGTIDIGGHKVKKSTAYLVGAAGAGVIVIAVMRKRSAAAAASTASAMVTDPAGNQCATLDPATGYCPGTAADTAAQQAAATGSSADYADAGGGGGSGYYVPPATGTGTSGTGSAVPAFQDNASWGQYVETALGSNGSDAIAAAIAKYLSGQPVTEAQQTTIEEAIALANTPPVSGTNGNPPSMTLIAAPPSTGTTPPATGTTPPSTGTTPPSTGTTPPAAGKTAPKPAAPAVPSARSTAVTSSSVTLAWAKVAGATSYRVRATYQGAVTADDTVTGTSATVSGLTSDHTYTFHVASIGPGGTSSETNGPAVKTSR